MGDDNKAAQDSVLDRLIADMGLDQAADKVRSGDPTAGLELAEAATGMTGIVLGELYFGLAQARKMLPDLKPGWREELARAEELAHHVVELSTRLERLVQIAAALASKAGAVDAAAGG